MKPTQFLGAIAVSGVLLAGCSKPATDAGVENPASEAATDAQEADASAEGDDAPLEPSRQDMVKFAAVMAAAVEFCGLATPEQSKQGLQALKDKMAAEGGSPDQVERVYRAAFDDAKAKAAADPAKLERDCEGLRKMGDPETIKQMEQAAEELEAKARDMGG